MIANEVRTILAKAFKSRRFDTYLTGTAHDSRIFQVNITDSQEQVKWYGKSLEFLALGISLKYD